MMILAPSATPSPQNSLPIPLLPPVTSIVLPATENMALPSLDGFGVPSRIRPSSRWDIHRIILRPLSHRHRLSVRKRATVGRKLAATMRKLEHGPSLKSALWHLSLVPSRIYMIADTQ